MPMEITQHEEHLNALLELITDGEQRAAAIDHLDSLRSDYGSTVEEYNGLTEKTTKLDKEVSDLVKSNSKLFRERAIIPESEKKEEEVSTDENVTLESLGL